MPLTLAHRSWVARQGPPDWKGRSRSGLPQGDLPGCVAIRDGLPVGYCLYSIERSGWEFTAKEKLESRPALPAHPAWLASPAAARYQTECCLVALWPSPHPILLQGLRQGAAARNAYRIYTLIPENRTSQLTAVGFRQVAFYPDDQLVELECPPH